MEIDGVLNEKLLRKEDAKRKKAWFEEERREIELSPFVREYLIVRDKKGFFGTAEGRARLDELGKTHEVRSWRRNSMNILRASEDVIAAGKELMEYRKSHSSSQAPIPKLPRAAASDGKSRLFLGCNLMDFQFDITSFLPSIYSLLTNDWCSQHEE